MFDNKKLRKLLQFLHKRGHDQRPVIVVREIDKVIAYIHQLETDTA